MSRICDVGMIYWWISQSTSCFCSQKLPELTSELPLRQPCKLAEYRPECALGAVMCHGLMALLDRMHTSSVVLRTVQSHCDWSVQMNTARE
jgi:hypothetical protein